MKRIFSLIFILFFLIANSAFSTEDEKAFQKAIQDREASLSAEYAKEALSDESQVIGVELIVAGKGPAFYSRWGHAILRFVKKDGDIYHDAAVSFLADMPTDREISTKEMYKKGILGEFKSQPVIKSSAKFWRDYVVFEKRPLLRYIIPTSPQLRHQLLETLKAWIKNPGLIGNYKFVTNNCAGIVVKLLNDSGFPHALTIMDKRVPTYLPNYLAWSTISAYPEIKEDYTQNETISFKTVPEELYSLCDNEACAEDLLNKEATVWSKDQLSEVNRMRDFVYWSIFADRSLDYVQEMTFKEDISKAPKRLVPTSGYLKHLQLLLFAHKN